MSAQLANALPSEIIDDRSTGTLQASNGHSWRLITDQVMGGVSQGQLELKQTADRPCVGLNGTVSTERNGGFIQMALELAEGGYDASAFDGIELQLYGNDEMYNLHLRTTGLWLPWQSYRTQFIAVPRWQTVRVPFSILEAYRTHKKFDPRHLSRLGLVAIGRAFDADLCVGRIRFYRERK